MSGCKDCGSTTRRLIRPGPRCATCQRARAKAISAARHTAHIKAVFGITAGQYSDIIAAQGGVCAICRRANGRTRRLATDHNHITGEVRGCLCSRCNVMLGHLRDDPAAFQRAIDYLNDPPARSVL